MTRKKECPSINSFLKGRPMTLFFVFGSEKDKVSVLKAIIESATLLQKQVIYVDTLSKFFQRSKYPDSLIVISPFPMSLYNFFSTIMSSSKSSILIIDSYPTLTNVFFGEEDKADRFFLYFLSKIKHVLHVVVFVNTYSRKLLSLPIYDRRFFDRIYYHGKGEFKSNT